MEDNQPQPATIPRHFVRSSQAYIAAWCCISIAASSGTIDSYRGAVRQTAPLVFAGITVAVSTLIALGLLVELRACHKEKKISGCLDHLMFKLAGWDFPDKSIHVATNLLSISSTALASIYLYTEVWDWKAGMMLALLIMSFMYNVVYTPSILLSVAAWDKLSDTSRQALGEQFMCTSYIWKKSYVDDRLMPCAT